MDLTGLGSIADFAKTIVDKFFPPQMSGTEKAEYQLRLQAMLEARETATIDAQKSIIVAEMSQADNFTKRARPMVVYSGLVFIFLNHVFFPIVARIMTIFSSIPTEKIAAITAPINLPAEFWWAWTGVVGVWIVGRTAEKIGSASRLTEVITGGKK